MAKQKGFLKLRGSIGDLNFYKSKDGYMVREKSSIDRNTIMSDPRFQRTRENMQEFKNAGTAGKTLRNAFNAIIKNAKDSRLSSRLTKVMHGILKEDTTNARGQRNVHKGNQLLMKGFDFNAGASWLKTVLIPVQVEIERISGETKFTLEAYKPLDVIIAPQGATNYRFVAASTEIDFEKNEYITKTSYTNYYPYDEVEVNDVELLNNLSPNSEHTIALAIGIEFYQEVNTVLYPLKNGSFNAAHLIEINLP
ncbi:hypothetical protein OBJ96_11645 [Empedobacter falsenii]|uniref:hypothetical protein n=1 Tax=Empedobacter TaxID=59734 RepID=UPI001CE1AB3E|nr:MULTISPECIES: hypothetical protein [Empedobacter]MCA4782783.1 hypothetical protein [Empedobacter stercoris]MDM1522454.1 hypothetical protein [Empedobacter sp. 225-1]MDM1542644.1 hypothetical protein [Empedobacter sp. 189-2]